MDDFEQISHLYTYLNPPPHGAGTAIKLVLETASRSIKYSNPTKECQKEINDYGETLYHQRSNSKTILDGEIQGWFDSESAVSMITHFRHQYDHHIQLAVEKTIKWAHAKNISEISKGKQTLNVLDGSTIKAATALERYCHFLRINGMGTDFSLIGFCDAFWDLFSKDKIIVEKTLYQRVPKKRGVVGKGTFKKTKVRTVYEGREKDLMLFNQLRTLETFRKDGERGKSKRRAIASPGIPMRVFFRIIEEFAKNLCANIPESTISIGGEEKKNKIQELLNHAKSKEHIYHYKYIITGDNTKWNETMSPELMADIMEIFTTPVEDSSLKLNNNILYYNDLMKKISHTLFGAMFQKRLNTSLGFKVEDKNSNFTKYLTIGQIVKDNKIPPKMEEEINLVKSCISDERYIVSSAGMVMGMLNIFSTLVGLIAGTYNNRGQHDQTIMMDAMKERKEAMRLGREYVPNIRSDLLLPLEVFNVKDILYLRGEMLFLQSSDDFFAISMGRTDEIARNKIKEFYAYCKLLGINWSVEKTKIRSWDHFGVGEYTSWFVFGSNLIPQWGSDTAQMRPQGINAQCDLASFISGIHQKLCTRNINYIGAEIALRLHARFLRVLYRIKKGRTPMALPESCCCLANGGEFRYRPSNVHIEEVALILSSFEQHKANGTIDQEVMEKWEKYLRRLLNPSCPLNSSLETVDEFNPETMTMETREIGLIMNANNVKLRSNKKISNKKLEEVETKEIYSLVSDLAYSLIPSLTVADSNSRVSLRQSLTEKIEIYRTLLESYPDKDKERLTRKINEVKEFLER